MTPSGSGDDDPTASSRPLRLALVGCGRMGRLHLPDLVANAQRRLTVVVEPDDDAWASGATTLEDGGHAVPLRMHRLEELLHGQVGVDGVVLATPHHVHFNQVRACLQAGLHVLVEKPLVTRERQARDLLAEARRADRVLSVGYNACYTPSFGAAVELVGGGGLGDISAASGTIWEHWVEPNRGTWRLDPDRVEGGFLSDTGVHMLHTMLALLPHGPVSVTCRMERRGTPVDVVSGLLVRLANGAVLTFLACGDAGARGHSELFVHGTLGSVRIGAWGDDAAVMGRDEVAFQPLPGRPRGSVVDQFTAAVVGGSNPCDARASVRTAALLEAVSCSAARNGAWVDLPGADAAIA